MQKGYWDRSFRDIATEAGISSLIIYYYFKNKEEMLFEVIKSGTQDLIQSLREIKQRIKDPEGCLREMLRAHIIVGPGKVVMKKQPLINTPKEG